MFALFVLAFKTKVSNKERAKRSLNDQVFGTDSIFFHKFSFLHRLKHSAKVVEIGLQQLIATAVVCGLGSKPTPIQLSGLTQEMRSDSHNTWLSLVLYI